MTVVHRVLVKFILFESNHRETVQSASFATISCGSPLPGQLTRVVHIDTLHLNYRPTI